MPENANDLPLNTDSTPLTIKKRVDEACDRFEVAWRAGQRPRIEAYLIDSTGPESTALLRELLALEIDLRLECGEKPTAEEYAARFQDQVALIQATLARLLPLQGVQNPTGETVGVDSTWDEPALVELTPVPSASPPSSSASLMPQRIGRYIVVRRLGGGAFGDVYLANDEVMGRQVAVKVPTRRLLATAQAEREFLREAQSVARLQHEGIARAFDLGQEKDGPCYIVYEYVEGTTLAERVKQSALSHQEAALITAQVAEALHYAHTENLVHRDIKPANILLDRKGRPRVLDFGLAIREEELHTQRGLLAGTLPYMSPEQLRREAHHVDGRSDIYSLGVVLYELLCGRRPFEAVDEDELKDQILHREARPPRQIKDSIPQGLEAVCLKALSKRVQDRYTTAKDMAQEILGAIESSNNDKRERDTAITLQEIEKRIASADEFELQRLLRLLQEKDDPACVPLLFRCLGHSSEPVRQQARKAVHSIGWNKVSDIAKDMARRNDADGIASVLDGLAAFEAHPQIVALLDRLVILLKGDLRNRTILLLERKRLGLELDSVAGLFRDIHSPYRIDKVLGQGLFSAAYLAHADGTELAVVVRVLRPEFVAQPHLRAEFLDLCQKALHMVHENLVLTREARAFPERNTYYVVRDYVDGVTLQKLLEGGKRFEPAQIVRIVQQLLAALSVVHRRGICHRGVKPSNVFVCEEDRVVLGDPALPLQGIGVGFERLSYDYRYAASESFRGDEVVQQSDFYSLGCVAYELACGQPPFVSDNYIELAASHMHETIVPPSKRGSELGPAGDEVLLKLLARSPAERYTKAADILRALGRLEATWRFQPPAYLPPPLLRDASLARFRGAESVLGFEASAASLMQDSGDTLGPGPAEPQGAPPVHPTRVGNYEILELLGSGGMGVVYKALDTRLQRVVALKMLPYDAKVMAQRAYFDASQQQLPRFRQEALAVAKLQDPHIVQIYDIGEHEGQPYIALEYVAGGSLAERLRSEPLLPRAAAETVAKLARAVHHAHEQGVLHRDLKPSNVLLTPDGQPKIADFGLAKLQDLPTDHAAKTITGMIIGTPSYMAPEQAGSDIGRIGPAADIYSLGAILYATLTGRPPFQGESVMKTLSRLATEEVVPPHTLNPAVSLDLSAICIMCLEKDPQKRYSSAQGLAEDLEQWLAGGEIQASRATFGNRFTRWLQQSIQFPFRKPK